VLYFSLAVFISFTVLLQAKNKALEIVWSIHAKLYYYVYKCNSMLPTLIKVISSACSIFHLQHYRVNRSTTAILKSNGWEKFKPSGIYYNRCNASCGLAGKTAGGVRVCLSFSLPLSFGQAKERGII
jgi:hypothetical protein